MRAPCAPSPRLSRESNPPARPRARLTPESELPTAPRPVTVDRARKALAFSLLEAHAPGPDTGQNLPTKALYQKLRMGAAERIARRHLDCVVGLSTTSATRPAVELGIPARTGRPAETNSTILVATTAIHSRSTTTTVRPGAGSTGLGRALLGPQWIAHGGSNDDVYASIRYTAHMTTPRPILARYVDPLELVWLATAKRLGLHIRRNPEVFSATDGSGLLELGPRRDLDPDDTLSQQVLHEICHWVIGGLDAFHERDWGFPLDIEADPECEKLEHAVLRLQAWLTEPHGLRGMMAPTGMYRCYYDRLPADVMAPIEPSRWEHEVCELAREAVARVQSPPWWAPLQAALEATRALRTVVQPFMDSYTSEVENDSLPSLWRDD